MTNPGSAKVLSCLLVLLVGLSTGAHAATAAAPGELEVHIAPGSFLIAREARHVGLGYEGTSSYYDLVVQAIYFVNRGAAPLTLEGATLEVLAAGEVLQSTTIPTDEIGRSQAQAAAIAGMYFPLALDIY